MYFADAIRGAIRGAILACVLPFATVLGILWPWESNRPGWLLRLLAGSAKPEHCRSADVRLAIHRLAVIVGGRRAVRLPAPIAAPLYVASHTARCLWRLWLDLKRSRLPGPRIAEWGRALPPTLRFSLETPENYLRQNWSAVESRVDIEHFLSKGARNTGLAALAIIHGAPGTIGHFNKLEFHRRCEAAGLPNPAVYVVFDRGAARTIDARTPTGDLFSKSLSSARSEGLYLLWRRADDGRWRTELGGGKPLGLDFAGVQRFLADESKRRGPMLLQEVVANHPAVQAFVRCAATCCVRLHTCRFPDGRIERQAHGYTLLKEGAVDDVVDNSAQGGRVYKVDFDSGAVATRALRDVGPDDKDPAHPLILPHWPAAKDLCVKAHADAFPEYVAIAWDVAISPNGPALVEANVLYGGPGEYPGTPRSLAVAFGDCLRAHLDTVRRSDLDRLRTRTGRA